MSTLHSKLPKIINLIDEVDKINFEHTSEFIISEGIVGANRIIRVTHKEDGHHPDSHFIIMDDTAKILLKGVHLKQKCFQKVLNVYSPVGFILGSVRERCFKGKADYEIRAGNQDVLFLLKHENNVTECFIKITDSCGQDLVAKAALLPTQDGKVMFTLTYVRKIPVLCKLQILCAVLSYYQQDRRCFQPKHNSCLMIKDKLDSISCFPLYYDSKVLFYILCFLFPLVIVVYLVFIVFVVAYVAGTLFTLLICCCRDKEPDLSCLFNWPCRICKNKQHCSAYFWCCNQGAYRIQFLVVISIVILFHASSGWQIYLM